MPQNKIYLHPESGEPIDSTNNSTTKTYLDDNGEVLNDSSNKDKPNESKGGFWNWATTPLTNIPSELANSVANEIDFPSLDRSPMRARLEGMAGGMAQGIGNVVDDMTSPLGLAMTLGPKIPGATKLLGYPTELAGSVIKKYGIGLPRILESRLQRGLERNIGRGIEYVGSKMKSIGNTGKELTSESLPKIVDGEIISRSPSIPIPKELPPSKVDFYSEPTKDLKLRMKLDSDLPIQEGQEIPKVEKFKVIRQENQPLVKPKLRANGDGTFTNLDTGEMFDKKGNSIIEINGKPAEKFKPHWQDEFMNDYPDRTPQEVIDKELKKFADDVLLTQKNNRSILKKEEPTISKNSPFFFKNRPF